MGSCVDGGGPDAVARPAEAVFEQTEWGTDKRRGSTKLNSQRSKYNFLSRDSEIKEEDVNMAVVLGMSAYF